MGIEGDFRPPGDGITRSDDIINVDVLYFHAVGVADPIGLGEVVSGDIAVWCLPWIQKLINDTPLDQIQINILHNWESNCITSHVDGVENVGLFDRLHWLADQLNINPSQITWINGNFKIWKHYDHWRELTPNVHKDSINLKCMIYLLKNYAPILYNGFELDEDDDNSFNHYSYLENSKIDPNRPMEYVYNCLNRVPRKARMSLYKRLAENDLIKYGLVSFNERPSNKGVMGIDGDYMSDELYNNLPIYLDFNPTDDYANVNEWILTKINRHQYERSDNETDKHINHFNNIINNSFITVVPETEYGIPESLFYNNLHADPIDNTTYLSYHNGFITEKTFRHIRDGHPMLWVSAPYTCDMLHYLGFKTFNPIINESYDRELDPIKRLDMVTDELKRLCNLTQQERVAMYHELIPILEHNQQHLLNMKEIPLLTRDDWEIYAKDWKFLNLPATDGIIQQQNDPIKTFINSTHFYDMSGNKR